MCGGFALSLGAGHALRANLGRQLIYTSGRVCTYGLLGAIAGAVGGRVTQSAWLTSLPAWLAICAGLLLCLQGLHALGLRVWPRRAWRPGCLAAGLFAPLLHRPGTAQAFLVGVATGFLPCGLLYGYLTLAASSGSLLTGGLTMVLFALGTAPLMILTGAGGSLLALATRTNLLRAAALCVLLTGGLSIARGVQALRAPQTCPFCRSTAAAVASSRQGPVADTARRAAE